MVQKNKNIKIEKNNIFQEDLLDREKPINNITSIISSTNVPFVLSLNAQWGAGKTTFVKLLKSNLDSENIKSIYFNAWEYDFVKEPFVSILGELNKFIKDEYPDTEISSFFDKSKKLAVQISTKALPAFIKHSTAGVLDLDKGYEGAISALTENMTSSLIENYGKDRVLREEFKKSMKEVFEKIDKDKPFVFFIDELDRCRPLYAIELLESIKHIFGIEKLIFVLSIDKVQLAESIKSQYGNIDSNNYLKRFIDLEYNLSNPSIDEFCYSLIERFELRQILKGKKIHLGEENGYLELLKLLANTLSLSLRQIEQIFTHLGIIFKTIEHKFSAVYFNVIIFFVVLKSYNSSLYLDVINKRIDMKDIKELTFNEGNNYFKALIEAISLSILKNNHEHSELIKEKEIELTELTHTENKYDYKNLIIKFLKCGYDYGYNYYDDESCPLNQIINVALSKIEFTEQFS